MRIETRALEAFAAVMTLGTATAAAGVLARSQPAITRSLQQLEERTGLVLFERRAGRLVPTPEARELHESVRESFALVERVERRAAAIRRRLGGELRVSCVPAFSQRFIGRAVAGFGRLYPDVGVQVTARFAAPLAQALRAREVDVGIVAYGFHDEALCCTPFTECNEVLAMPRDHVLTAHERVGLEDLAGERLVVLGAGDPYRLRLDAALAEAGVVPGTLAVAESSTTACALVACGAGVGLVNPLTALEFAGAGLVTRAVELDAPYVTTLVHRHDVHPSGFVRRFLEELEQVRDDALERAIAMSAERGDAVSERDADVAARR